MLLELRMSLNLLGIKTIALPTFAEDGFMPSTEQCASLITAKTKAIALVTPNNPVCFIITYLMSEVSTLVTKL